MVIKNIFNNVYVIIFDTQYEMNMTCMRFTESIECDNFKNSVFTIDEFINWYTLNGRNPGNFTYYTDWNGHNFSKDKLTKFYQGQFNPLQKYEKDFLSLCLDVESNGYIISIHKEHKNIPRVIAHEVAHSLFRNIEYSQKVIKIINEYPELAEHSKQYVSKLGYSNDIIIDEQQAYLISGYDGWLYNVLVQKIRQIFCEYNNKLISFDYDDKIKLNCSIF